MISYTDPRFPQVHLYYIVSRIRAAYRALSLKRGDESFEQYAQVWKLAIEMEKVCKSPLKHVLFLSFLLDQHNCVLHIGYSYATGISLGIPKFLSQVIKTPDDLDINYTTSDGDPSQIVETYVKAWWEDPIPVVPVAQDIVQDWEDVNAHRNQVNVGLTF